MARATSNFKADETKQRERARGACVRYVVCINKLIANGKAFGNYGSITLRAAPVRCPN